MVRIGAGAVPATDADAGRHSAESRMVRPLPNGTNWTADLLTANGIRPGATIRMKPSGVRANSAYPHRTEDTPIDATTIELASEGPQPWFGAAAPPAVTSLAEAFGRHVRTTGTWNNARKGTYVQKGSQVGSLSALRIGQANLDFFENDFKGKKSLRAYMTDTDERYSLPVVAKHLRELYRARGPMALNESLPEGGVLHVRVGLARAWHVQPERCTVMINGVYW